MSQSSLDGQNSEESLEITECTKGIHPLLIPHIVQNILEKFGDNEMFGVPRQVCSVWNDEAIRSLRLRSSMEVSLVSGFDSSFYELCLPTMKTKFKARKSSIDITKLYQLLESSQNPDIILNSVIAECKTNTAECKPLLQTFGHSIKRLTYESEDVQTLHSCITHFCPNLESLHIEWEHDAYFDFEIPSNYTLQIKEFRLSGEGDMDNGDEEEGGDWSDLNECCSAFTAILNASPLLEVLQIDAVPSFKDYFNAMKAVPDITRQLKQICFEGDFMKNLDLLNSIEFGPNLKSVTLNSSYETEFDEGESEVASRHPKFVRFLTKIANSIDCLRITGIIDGMERFDSNGYADLPKFPMLKSLIVEASFTSLNFVSKMPILDQLYFTSIGAVDQILLDTSSLLNKFQKFSVSDDWSTYQPIDAPGTIELLNNAFPNICKLGLDLILPKENFKEWIEEAFQNISQMINLEVLSLNLDTPMWTKVLKSEDLETAFDNLKNTPNLEKLQLVKFGNGKFRNSNASFCQCSPKPLLKLVDSLKLKRLELLGLHISKVNKSKLMPQTQEEVEAFLEFRRTFERNGIVLTIMSAKEEFKWV